MIDIAHAPCRDLRVKRGAQIPLPPQAIPAYGREVHARKRDVDAFHVRGLQSRYERVVFYT